MAENKKKRIAHIGNLSSVQGTTNCDDGLVQADCNLVYNIMESMNKSQNLFSYQQLQDFRSKENPISRTNNSDQNSKPLSKQIKKFIPEKTFPLMAKCQKSMKYLKKNRCIPKPRAHVGFIPKPPQNPVANFKPNDVYSNSSVSNNTQNHKQSVKRKRNFKKSKCSEGKKLKPSHSSDNFCDKKDSQTENFEKGPKVNGNVDSGSDNEFERFLQIHQPEKYSSPSDNSDSSTVYSKTEKSNTIKRRKNVRFKRAKKVTLPVSRKTLSDTEESESEAECKENNCKNINIDENNLSENSCKQQFPQKRFQRIVECENSEDSTSDAHVNDFCTPNYDSYNSSEDENMVSKSLNKEDVNVLDLKDSEKLDTLASEPSSVATISISLSQHKDTSSGDGLKLKCKIPCYVVINRDPLLDKKITSPHTDNFPVNDPLLDKKTSSSHTDNFSVNEVVTVPNLEDADCIILSETSTANIINPNSENQRHTIENRTSFQESAVTSKSDGFEPVNDVPNKSGFTEKISSSIKSQPLLLNPQSSDILHNKNVSLEVQRDDEIEISKSPASLKSPSDTRNISEKKEFITVTEATGHALNANRKFQHSSDLPNKETDISLNSDRTSLAAEKDAFNVQILSVASLNESDIIVLSDSDEKDTETVLLANKASENAEDSDIEIICYDSSFNKEKFVMENVKETQNLVNNASKENVNCSLVQNEDDCIILDDVDLKSANTCTPENLGKVQPSKIINEQLNTNINEEAISVNMSDSDKNSILKTLGTIDFNCIKKVLKETTVSDIWQVKNLESVASKSGNSLCDNQISNESADSFPERLKQTQNFTGLPEKRTLLDASVASIGSSEVEKSDLETLPADTSEEDIKLVTNSNVFYKIIKNDSGNVPLVLNSVSSSNDGDKSSKFCSSRTDPSAPKLSVYGTGKASGRKIGPNASLSSRKIQPVLPICSTIDKYDSPSDELDIIAANSIKSLNDEHLNETLVPMLELYKAEYKIFKKIKSTEQNVTAGLKLLEEKQTTKLMVIRSSIKQMVKDNACLHAIAINERKSCIDAVDKDESLNENKCLEPLTRPCPDIEKDNKVKIFNQSVVKRASEVLQSKSIGPSSSQEVYNLLINSVCAECGKQATAACLGCANIYYCSEKCGMTYWNNGHYATCRR